MWFISVNKDVDFLEYFCDICSGACERIESGAQVWLIPPGGGGQLIESSNRVNGIVKAKTEQTDLTVPVSWAR